MFRRCGPAGVPFLTIPVRDIGTAGRVEFDPQAWERTVPFVDGALASAFIYCRGAINHNAKFHARMFAAGMGIVEDPATGSAVAALSGAIHHFDRLARGTSFDDHRTGSGDGQTIADPSAYRHRRE